MSKEELVDILYEHGIAAGLDDLGQNALDAMVAAYNRAIDDVLSLSYIGYPHLDPETDTVVDVRDVEKLKI